MSKRNDSPARKGLYALLKRDAEQAGCEPIVTDAECCKHCKNTGADFTFSDAVLCFKTNNFQFDTQTCQLFERKEE